MANKLEKTNYPSVYKKKLSNGSYSFFIKYRDEAGRNKRVKVGSGSAKEANRELNDAKALVLDIKAGKVESRVNNVSTLNDLADEFFRGRVTKTNHKDISSYDKWVRSGLGTIKHPIPSMNVERFQRGLQTATVIRRDGSSGVMANASVNLITDLVRSILNWGLKHKMIGYINPFVGLKRMKVSNIRERWLSKDELDRLFEFKGVVLEDGKAVDAVAKKSYNHYLIQPLSRDYMLLFKLAYYTGSRPISYLGLELSDVSVVSKDVNSPDYMKPISIYFKPVKEGDGYSVGVSDKLETVLWARLLDMVEKSETMVIPMSYDRIQKNVSVIMGYLFNGGFKVESRAWMGEADYSVKGGTKHTRLFNGSDGVLDLITDDRSKCMLYTLRHTTASHIVAETGNLQLASEILNHSDIKTTMRYSKVGDDAKKRAISVL